MRSLVVLPILAAFAAAFFAPSATAEPPHENIEPGPIGWEKHIAPGFDPPIEYVIVHGSAWMDPAFSWKDCVEKWGPGAAPVLVNLYRNPEWAKFRDTVLSLIGVFSTPEVKSFLESEYAKELAQSTREGQNKLPRLLALMRTIDPERAKQWVDEGLKDIASPHFRTFVIELQNRVAQTKNAEDRAKLELLLKMRGEGELRTSILHTLEYDKSIQRAEEPMDKILKLEGEKK